MQLSAIDRLVGGEIVARFTKKAKGTFTVLYWNGMRYFISTHAATLGLLTLVVSVLVWNIPALGDAFDKALLFFQGRVTHDQPLAIAIFVVLSALSAMFAPLSTAPIVPFAVVVWGGAQTFALLMLGWMVGGALTYTIGRYGAHPFFRNWKLYHTIEHYREHLSEQSQFTFVLLFRIALPAEIPGYVLGAIRYSWWRYMLATFISEIFVAFLLVFASEAFLRHDELELVGGIAVAVAVFSVCAYAFAAALKNGHVGYTTNDDQSIL